MLPKDRIIVWSDEHAPIFYIRMIVSMRYAGLEPVNSWEPVKSFDQNCLVDEEQVKNWFSQPGVDERYQVMVRI